MKLPDLLPEHAQPREIIYSTRRIDSLLKRARPHTIIKGTSNLEGIPNNSASQFPRTDRLRTTVAVLPEQLEVAEQLVRRRYAWRGYGSSSMDTPAAATLDGEDRRVTLLVDDHGKVLGTLTVRLDSPQGLLAEETYRTEIETVRLQGRRVAEITKLAVEEGVDWKSTIDALVQSAYFVTRVIHSLNDVFIEVNPRHVRFYGRVLGFVVAASERICSRVGAPSILMQLDLEEFGQRLLCCAS